MRPKDVLALRRVLMRDCEIQRTSDQRLVDDSTTVGDVCPEIRAALTTAEMYLVTADMAAVVKAAARTMPNQPLRLDDLPSTEGFLLWDAPVAYWVDGADERVPIAGVVWSVSHHVDEYRWIDDDVPPIMTVDEWRRHPGSTEADGSFIEDIPNWSGSWSEVEIWPLISLLPRGHELMPIGWMSWDIGTEPLPFREDDAWLGGVANDDYELAAPLLTTWTLMQQTITVSVPARVGPTDAKRDARLALPSDLVVVRLRRHSIDSEEPPGEPQEGNWSHQWIVGGHWRNQWLPSRNAHRLQWIAPYIKGPAGAPLVVKERVAVWSR
jgi:hypothetical protein